ncbi:MAG: hypothetical protein QOH39_1735 [Verrucomicrobiota bacterium]
MKWRAGAHKIIKNPIGDRFIEGAHTPERSEIEFERFAFNAKPVGHIFDVDPREIGLTGDRAERCKIVRFEMNAIGPSRWILECLEARLIRGGGNPGFAPSEQRKR